MSQRNVNNSILNSLETLELVGITFLRGYIQFLFDEPVLNTYTLPLIKIEKKIILSTDTGYFDNLYRLIGKKIVSTHENEEEITIHFESDVELIVSLRFEDRNCAEAVMLQLGTEGQWNVW